MIPLVLIGGGGHCKSVIDVIEAGKQFSVHGILDQDAKDQDVLGYPVIGSDDDIVRLAAEGFSFHISVGHIKSNAGRRALFHKIKEAGGKLPVIISPSAMISKHCRIGDGTIIMHNVVVNANAAIGENCIINTGSIIEHDARVGDHCHISTGAVINGAAVIEANSFIGSNSTIIQAVNVGSFNITGAGTVIIKDIPADSTVVGNPAVIKRTGK